MTQTAPTWRLLLGDAAAMLYPQVTETCYTVTNEIEGPDAAPTAPAVAPT